MISLLLGLVLFTLVDDFVLEFIIQPLLHVIWFVSLIVDSLPQGVLWVGFILVMMIVSYSGFKKRDKPGSYTRVKLTRNLGAVESWAQLLEKSQKSIYSKWRLAQKLKLLTQELLVETDIAERASKGISKLELPVDIRAYFEEKLPSRGSLMKRLRLKEEESDMAIELDPEAVLQHLKKRLNL
jgi:hypothetical protein